MELKATADDLAKAKTALTTCLQEVESLKEQLEQARQASAASATAGSAEYAAQIEQLRKELSNAKEEYHGLQDAFQMTKESMQEMSNNHTKELESAAMGRAEEVTKLRAAHNAEVQSLVVGKSELVSKLSDLEGEVVTLRASMGAEPTTSPKRNSTSQAAIGITKEELQKMYEAHSSKLHDMEAEHERALKALQERLGAALGKTEELEQDVERKAMEIRYLEQDQEENQDQITKCVLSGGSCSLFNAILTIALYRSVC